MRWILLTFLPLALLSGCLSAHDAKLDSKVTVNELLFIETGRASFYSDSLVGNITASGEVYSPGEFTAAHPTLPFGTLLFVRRTAGKRGVIVRVNDRGPFIAGRRVDLSRAAAQKLGIFSRGIAKVDVFVIPERSQLAAML